MAESTRRADFDMAMGRLGDVRTLLGLLADRWDIQTATVLERILDDVITFVSRNDFPALLAVQCVATTLVSRREVPAPPRYLP